MKVSRYLIVLSLFIHALAHAQATEVTADAKARASAHFRRGVELFQEEAFRGALVEFERAYSIAPDYRLLYNIGQAKYETQDYLGAIQSYERYLEEGGDEITQERKTAVAAALAALRERVGTIHIIVNRKNAEVFIDDVSVGMSPLIPMRVNVGRHRVSARSAAGATDAEVVSVAGGDTTEVALTLIDPIAGVAAAPEKKPMPAMQKAAIAVWASAGGVLIASLVTGLRAKSAQDDLDDLRNTPDVSRTRLDEQHDKVQRLALTTDVLIGVGAAAAVTGTVMWVLGRDRTEKKDEHANLRLNVGFGSLGVHGSF